MVSWIDRGTPAAVPLDDPKLGRMSWRTTPLWSRTSGPLEPSPGKGPAVSSGISAQLAAVASDAAAEAAAAEAVAFALADALAPPPGVQPAITNSPALNPPNPRALSTWRRCSVPRS